MGDQPQPSTFPMTKFTSFFVFTTDNIYNLMAVLSIINIKMFNIFAKQPTLLLYYTLSNT